MNINSVDGSGHETPDLAYNARPVNMNAEILVWDEADMKRCNI